MFKESNGKHVLENTNKTEKEAGDKGKGRGGVERRGCEEGSGREGGKGREICLWFYHATLPLSSKAACCPSILNSTVSYG